MSDAGVAAKPTAEEKMASFKSYEADMETGSWKEIKPENSEKEPDKTQEGAETGESEAETPVNSAEETASEAESAEKPSSDEKTAENPAEAAKKPKQTAQERISELAYERKQARRELAAAQEQHRLEIARLQGEMEAFRKGSLTQPTQGATSQQGEGAPDPSKFEYGELDPKYIRALAQHYALEVVTQDRAENAKRAEADARARGAQEVQTKFSEFEKKGMVAHEDFDEVVVEGARNGQWKLSDALGSLILGSEAGPQIAYHLASNPKEAAQLFELPQLAQAAAFGRLESRFAPQPSGDKVAKQPQTTKAPPVPTTSLTGAGNSSVDIGADSEDFSAFENRYRAAKRRR